MQHCPNYLMHEDNQRMSQTLIGCLTHLKYSKMEQVEIYEKNIVDGH